MKRFYTALTGLITVLLVLTACSRSPQPEVPALNAQDASTDLLISGVIDGPLSGGVPKAIEFYAVNDIPDLSLYGFGSANNGGGSDGQEFTFPAVSVNANSYLYLSYETPGFNTFFGFNPDYTSAAASINGDDALELFFDGNVIDVFGDINTDGTGTAWDYMDGWAYRKKETGPDGNNFVLANWTLSGINALDGSGTNDSAANAFPLASYGEEDDSSNDVLELKIHEIQGNGDVSPYVGSTVMIEAVVVADFQDGDTNGFFVQEEDSDVDADPLTSEGILVYDSGFGVDVSVGDLVQVTGMVTEYFNLTEITNVTSVSVVGTETASPVNVSLPVADLDYWESVEGMLLTFPQTLYVTGNYTLGRYGEVDLSVNDRLYNPTNVATPGANAAAVKDLNDRSRIQLDDGVSAQNPVPLPPYFGEDTTLRAGDTVSGLTAVLSYGFGAYELLPVETVNFERVNDRQDSPDDVGGSLSVASFNVLNYFSTIDNNGAICGPSMNMDCRGADTNEEFERQRTKIIAAISSINADIVGLLEIENTSSDAIIDLVNGLNDAMGAGTYAYIDTGTIGTDAIRVALIYKPATVTPTGNHAILDSSVDPLFIDTKNRPALAQTFTENASGGVFTVAVNHLKSKGSDCDDLGDPDMGDGQGNCNQTRTDAATALVNWLATDPTGSNDPDVLIIGDLNAYAMEDPISAIKAAGYTNLIEQFVGLKAYSYVFAGEAGYLDHALANASLTPQVTGVTEWHINADEPPALDYNNYNQAELYAPGPFASSDHDPVIIGLELDAPVQDPEELLRLLRWDVYYAYRDGELRRPDMYVLQNRLLTASFFLRHDREFLAELFVKQFIRDVERLERKHRLDSDVADAFIADAEMVLTQLNH